MRHTPGPWKFEWRDGCRHVDSADYEFSIGDETYYPWVRATDADLTLIAAAPEMLEALKQALMYGLTERNLPMLLAAVDKAEGK